MVVEALLLPQNEYSDSLLEYLSTQEYSAKLLAVIQNAAIYYQALVTKRVSGSMSTAERDTHARTNYKSFTVPSLLMWWENECNVTPPSWLTLTLMGKTTGTDHGERTTHVISPVYIWQALTRGFVNLCSRALTLAVVRPLCAIVGLLVAW